MAIERKNWWCAWCGDDLPLRCNPRDPKKFCSALCSEEHQRDYRKRYEAAKNRDLGRRELNKWPPTIRDKKVKAFIRDEARARGVPVAVVLREWKLTA